MAGEMWTLQQTRIGRAILHGSPAMLKSVLAEGEDVTFRDRKGNTYLHFVCTMYRPYVFHILASSHKDINAKNKHGNTALHVSALHKECGHVSDLMSYGIDPFIKNKDGKTASELNSKGLFWQAIYQKYQPGIFRAVEEHDVERVRHLLHCWCCVDPMRNGQTLRQFSAARKHHDIVLLLDQHRHTADAIFGVLEVNYEKVERATSSEKCNINFLNKASDLQHVLLHALRLKDLRLVKMVCKAGANVNLPITLQSYLKAPLYFAAVSNRLSLDIVWTVLKSNADFLLKDQRGRNAVIFALDKTNYKIVLEVVEYMMEKGVYLADRDMTGLTARDVARLARRQDVRELLDRLYIRLLREEKMEQLQRLAQDGYDSMFINYNHRDTYIYASGNETDDIFHFIQQLPVLQQRVCQLQKAVATQAVDEVQQLLQSSDFPPSLLVNCKDKGGRSLLHLCVLYWRTDVMKFLLSLPYINCNAQDNLLRTPYHYACATRESEESETFRMQLEAAGCDTQLLDCNWLRAQDYRSWPKLVMDLDKERYVRFGLNKQLKCVDKYEELQAIICNKRRSLKHFKAAVRHFQYPVTSFAPLLSPLMNGYRDLLFLAVDNGQVEIAEYLAHLGTNLTRKEKYVMCGHHTAEVNSPTTSTETEVMSWYRESSSSCQQQPLPQDVQNDLHLARSEHQEVQKMADRQETLLPVECLSVVERARQLGLYDLVSFFEQKLQFQRDRAKREKRNEEENNKQIVTEDSFDTDIVSGSRQIDTINENSENRFLIDSNRSDGEISENNDSEISEINDGEISENNYSEISEINDGEISENNYSKISEINDGEISENNYSQTSEINDGEIIEKEYVSDSDFDLL